MLEPQTDFVDGWPLRAICEHLEAVTFGEVRRLLINVPPGFMKSLLTEVFWPAWEWGPMNMPHLRYVSFSYSAGLTERDNGKFRDLMMSNPYREMWGDRFRLRKIGETKITNDKTGSKLATSVGGLGTGERGDRVIVDDPHNVKDNESEPKREETVRWFRESLSNRLNDMGKSAVVVIMQRVHEGDVSGMILGPDYGDYEHLLIPMEYSWRRHTPTSIGWEDPRGLDDADDPLVVIGDDMNRYPRDALAEQELDARNGELAWPDRFSAEEVFKLSRQLGPYAYAAQYAQDPVPPGGGIFKKEWWQLWDAADGKFPQLDYVVASLDSAFTAKEENDPSGFTVLGTWTDVDGVRKVILIDAWRKHLPMHGPRIDQEPGEALKVYQRRTQPTWGLVEWVAHSCRRWKVDRLLIEAKASGITAAQEVQRLHGDEQWTVQLEQVTGDKVARAHAVVPAFSQLLVYAPDRDWADMVIHEMEKFPKGKTDDLTDSVTQAMKHLRAIGLIQHPEERRHEEERKSAYQQPVQPLYPV